MIIGTPVLIDFCQFSRCREASNESCQQSELPGQCGSKADCRLLSSKGKSLTASSMERCTDPAWAWVSVGCMSEWYMTPSSFRKTLGNIHMQGRLKKSWRQDESRFSKFPNRVSQIYVLLFMIDHEVKIILEKVFLPVATMGLCKVMFKPTYIDSKSFHLLRWGWFGFGFKVFFIIIRRIHKARARKRRKQ